jgi:hypothetical protein
MTLVAPLGAFTFVSLGGTPPSDLGLDPLPSGRSTFEVLLPAVEPWGNRFVPGRANVGLPNKGDPPQGLRPVRKYTAYPSPFGLIDLIGNAGDWVVNATSSYERVFMGATYRFDPEDATTFLMTPVTDENLTIKEITVRCAVGPDSPVQNL